MNMLSQTFKLECSVCKQDITYARQADTAVKKTLFGAAAYGVCACCQQEVDTETFNDRYYRKRVDKWHAKQLEPVIDIWYDRKTRSWVRQEKDAQGNQIGQASYSHFRPKK